MDGGSAMTGMASAYIAGSHQGTEPHNVEAHSVETRGYNSPGPGLEWSRVLYSKFLIFGEKLFWQKFSMGGKDSGSGHYSG